MTQISGSCRTSYDNRLPADDRKLRPRPRRSIARARKLFMEALEERQLLAITNLAINSSPSSGGLVGSYYDNYDFTNLKLTRTDPTINFNYGEGSPDPSIAVDTFSIRWDGYIMPLYNETYTFYVTHDDGARVMVNNQLVIDQFQDTGAIEHSGTITLAAGQLYPFHVEFREACCPSIVQLSWSSPSQAKQIIPASQYFTKPGEEMGVVHLTGNVTDPQSQQFPLTVQWGDGQTSNYTLAAGATSFDVTHTYRDDNPSVTPADTYTITATVQGSSGSSVATTSHTINNLPPVAAILNAPTGDVGENTTVILDTSRGLTDSDPGADDTLTYSWSVTKNGQPYPINQEQVLTFDGENDYVEIADSPSLHSDRQLTVSGWFKIDQFRNDWSDLVWKGNTIDCTTGCEDREFMVLVHRSGALQFSSTPVNQIGTQAIFLGTAAGIIDPQRWNHFAAVINADSNFMGIYVNGELKAQTYYDGSGIRDTRGPLRLGKNPSWTDGIRGSLDDIQIWNTARTLTEIRSDMNRNLTGNEPGLVGYWRMNESAGATVVDATANHNDGLLGEPNNGPSNPAWVSSTAPVTNAGAALSFDGANDVVFTPNLRSGFTDETVTLEVWFNPLSAGVVVDESGVQNPNNFNWHDSQIEILPTGEVRARVWNLSYVTLGTATFGTWQHAVLRYDKATQRLDGFLNGVASANFVTGDRQAPFEFNIPIYYGLGNVDSTNLGSGEYFRGQIDEFRVWRTARTQAQIQTSMNQSLVGNEPGLVAYYRFNENSGTTATDLSANQFHTTLGNPAGAASPRWVTPTPAPFSGSGTALDFDGLNDVVEVVDRGPQLINNQIVDPLHSSQQLTVTGWFRLDSFPKEWLSIFHKGNYPNCVEANCSSREYALWIHNSGALHLTSTSASNVGIGQSSLFTAPVVTPGGWHHFAAVIDSTTQRIQVYFDGVIPAGGEQPYPAGGIRDTTGPLQFVMVGHELDGALDGIRIYHTALTAQQVANDRARLSVGVSPVAEWNFDEGAGLVTADISGNGNNATLGIERPTRTTDSMTSNRNLVFVPNDSGTYQATVTITDDDGGSSTSTHTITAVNLPPVVNLGPFATIPEFSNFSRTGSFTDGLSSSWTATVNYGDGSGTQPLTLNADKTFSLNHFYADNGTYTVTVKVTDDEGAVATTQTTGGYAATVVAQGPQAYWRLGDTGSTVTDSSGNNVNFSLQLPYVRGQTGALANDSNGAFRFQYIPTTSTNPITGGQIDVNLPQIDSSANGRNTVMFWMNWDGTDNVMPFGFRNYGLQLKSNVFGFFTNNSDMRGVSAAPLLNTWVHVTAEFHNTNPALNKLYINGVEQTLTQTGTPVARQVTGSAAISGWVNNKNFRFRGLLDEVAFFNKQLTSTQIQAIYNARNVGTTYSTSVTAQSPIGYWRLGDTTAGSTVLDSSTFGNTGRVAGVRAAGAIPGDSNTAIWFDVGQVNLTLPNVNTAVGGQNSVSFWMKWNGTENVMPFGIEGYDLWLLSGGFGFNTGVSDLRGIESGSLRNRWVHVAAIFNNGDTTQSKLFIDGVEQKLTQRLGTPTSRSATANARISGWRSDTLYSFDGSLDEFAYFNRALTPQEIFQQYAASTTAVNVVVTNVAPTAAADSGSVDENGAPITINVLNNDTDVAGANDPLTVTAINTFNGTNPGARGTVTFNATSVTYDPAGKFEGLSAGQTATDVFFYTVDDGDGGKTTGTVTVTITGSNDAPVALDDHYAVDEDALLNVGVDTVAQLDYVNQVMADSPIVYLRLNESSGTFAANSGNLAGADGTFVSDPVLGADGAFDSNNNKAAQFNSGLDALITVGAPSIAPITPIAFSDDNQYSVELWFNATQLNGQYALVSMANAAGGHGVLLEISTNNTIRFLHRPQGTANANDGASLFTARTVQANQWNHLVATMNAGVMNVYINGVKDSVSAFQGTTMNQNLYMTIAQLLPSNGTRQFIGRLDEVALYDQALSAADVLRHYKAGRAGLLANDGDIDGGNVSVSSTAVTSTLGATVVMHPGGSFTYDGRNAAGVQSVGAGLTVADTFAYTIDDGQGMTDTAIVTVSVTGTNDAPTIHSSNLQLDRTQYHEGDTVQLSGLFADDGAVPHTVLISWGDGSLDTEIDLPAGVLTFTVEHRYLDNASGITVTVSDGLEDATANIPIIVGNLPPVIEDGDVSLLSTTILENGSVSLQGSFSDAGASDSHTVRIDWGDSTSSIVFLDPGSYTFDATHTYLDDNPSGTASDIYNILVTVMDDEHTLQNPSQDSTTVGLFAVRVHNVLPSNFTLRQATPGFVNEGSQIELIGEFDDPGTRDTYSGVIHWGDGSPPTSINSLDVTRDAQTGKLRFNKFHTYVDDPSGATASYTVSVNISDDDEPLVNTSATHNVEVRNVIPQSPALTFSNLPGNEIFENSVVVLSGSFSDPGSTDTHSILIHWGDGTSETLSLDAGIYSFTRSHTFLDDPTGTNDLNNIQVEFTDDDETTAASASRGLTIHNVAPSIAPADLSLEFLDGTPVTATGITEGQTIRLRGTFTDPGTLDAHTVTINWGDGSTPETIALPPGNISYTATHRYKDDIPTASSFDVNNIVITVNDDDAGSATATKQLTVSNVNPVVRILPGEDSSLTQFNFVSSVIDPGNSLTEVLTYAWTAIGGCVAFGRTDLTSFSVTQSGVGGDCVISLTVADDDLGSGTDTTQIIFGSDEADHIVLTGSPDNGATSFIILGLGGADTIDASQSDVAVVATGGTGNDTFIGSKNNDVFILEENDDRVISENAADQEGDDSFVIVCCSKLSVFDTQGINAIDFSRNAFGVTFDLGASGVEQFLNPLVNADGSLTVSGSFSTLTGSTFSDALINSRSGALNLKFVGGGGIDTFENRGANVQGIRFDLESFTNRGNNVRGITPIGADFDTLTNFGDFVEILASGADFGSLINEGASAEIFVNDADFDSLTSIADGLVIEAIGADFHSLEIGVAQTSTLCGVPVSLFEGTTEPGNQLTLPRVLDGTGNCFSVNVRNADFDSLINNGDEGAIFAFGADFASLTNTGDGTDIFAGGADFTSLIGDATELDFSGADFGQIVNYGRELTIHLAGADFDSLTAIDEGMTIDASGADFDSLINYGDLVTIEAGGADFSNLVRAALGTKINARGARFRSITNLGHGVRIHAGQADFESLLNTVAEIDSSGADFGTLVNQGNDVEIDAVGADFTALTNFGDSIDIDVSGADFETLLSDGLGAEILAVGADFASLTNLGDAAVIDVDGADFETLVTEGLGTYIEAIGADFQTLISGDLSDINDILAAGGDFSDLIDTGTFLEIDVSGADFQTLINTRKAGTIRAIGADFDSLINVGDSTDIFASGGDFEGLLGTSVEIDFSGADFGTLVNYGDDLMIDVSGGDFDSLTINSLRIDFSGADFESLVNYGDGVSIDAGGADFESLTFGSSVLEIDASGADFGSLINYGDDLTIDVSGGDFDSLTVNVLEIDFSGADFESLVNFGDHVTIEAGGADFDSLTVGSSVLEIDASGADFTSLTNFGDDVIIEAEGADFEQLISSATLDIDVAGADFTRLTNSGLRTTINVKNADFASLINVGDEVVIDAIDADFDVLINGVLNEIVAEGADFETLTHVGNFAEIDVTGADFDSLITTGDSVLITAIDADFSSLTNVGNLAELDLTGSDFDSLLNVGENVEIIAIEADFTTLINGRFSEVITFGSDFAELTHIGNRIYIDVTRAEFEALINTGDEATILAEGSDFGTLVNVGDSIEISVIDADFDTLINNGDGTPLNPLEIDAHGADFEALINGDFNEIIAAGSDYEGLTHVGDFVEIDVRGADFDSLISTGDEGTIFAAGADFETLVNVGDGTDIFASGGDFESLIGTQQEIDVSGADFGSLINYGDDLTIDVGGADLSSLVSELSVDIDASGSDFTTLINWGDNVVIDADGADFASLESIEVGSEIIADGADFETLVNYGSGVQIDVSGGDFTGLVSIGEGVLIEADGADFETLINHGDGVTIDASGADFEFLIANSTAEIDVSGADFSSLLNDGDSVEIIAVEADFESLVSSGDSTVIDVSGADFETLTNHGNFAELFADGADFDTLINYGNSVEIDALEGADFTSVTNNGSLVILRLSGTESPNTVVNRGDNAREIYFDAGGGSDTFVNTGEDVTSATFLGGEGPDTAILGGSFLHATILGQAGSDTYVFLGDLSGNVIIDEDGGEGDPLDPGLSLGSAALDATASDSDTLDFSGFTGAGLVLDLASTNVQPQGGLHLQLSSSTGLENVIGTSQGDTIFGNAGNNALYGADLLELPGGSTTPWNGKTQIVYLDFESETDDGEHIYTTAERAAIQALIAADYSPFHFEFTQECPLGLNVDPCVGDFFATLFFNQFPFSDSEKSGGYSSELDFRNTNLGGTASIQVNGILGELLQPAATSPNWIALSAKIAAHELGHLVGLRHEDSFGPIGFGIHVPPGSNSYIPVYSGPTNAYETFDHLSSSGASVGSDRFNDLNNLFFGEREAVKLAFANSGTVLPEAGISSGSAVNAKSLALTPLLVPNTITSGRNAGKAFVVDALTVVGQIEAPSSGRSESDFYRFSGQKGELVNVQVMSSGLTRFSKLNVANSDFTIDSVVRILTASGEPVLVYNDDQFEPTDSSIVDFVLPETGDYVIEVDSLDARHYEECDLSSSKHPDNNPDSPLRPGSTRFDPVRRDAFDDACADKDVGNYELFIYRFAVGNESDEGDTLDGRGGADELFGGPGNDTFIISGPAGSTVKIIGGSGTNDLQFQSDSGVTVESEDMPTLVIPDNFTVEATGPNGASVPFATSATQNGQPVPVTCSPASGSPFALGTTMISCSAASPTNSQIVVRREFEITVRDTTPPILAGIANLSIEATGPSGATATWQVTAQDVVDGQVPVVCSQASGSVFAIGATTSGVTTVTCSATDAHDNTASATFTVTVKDTTPPVVSVPADMVLEATGSLGAVAEFTSMASDIVDGAVAVTCSPASGNNFPIDPHTPGVTTVTCSATDKHENSASASFLVTVKDTIPPVLQNVPVDFIVEATGPNGAVVTWLPPTSANDIVDGDVPVTCSPASGQLFPISSTTPGVTTVTCSATDRHQNSSSASFTVTVADRTPPVITVPERIVVQAATHAGTVVNYNASVVDVVDLNVSVHCSPPSDQIFPPGESTVVCHAMDRYGNQATNSFVVVVSATPTVTTAPNQSALEGTEKIFELGTFADPGDSSWTVTVDWGDGTTPTQFSVAQAGSLPMKSHTYVQNRTLPYVANVTIDDHQSQPVTTQFNVSVGNLPPDTGVVQLPSAGTPVGRELTFSMPFTDPGTADTHICSVDWGDGTRSTSPSAKVSVSQTGGAGRCTASHTYIGTGPVVVRFTITDESNEFDQSSVNVNVLGSILILNPTMCGALNLSGDSEMDVAGDIVVNSACPDSAIDASGKAVVTASHIEVRGGYDSKKKVEFHPLPTGLSQPFVDPLAGLPELNYSSMPSLGKFHCSSKTSTTINPGRYKEIKASGDCELTMASGVYVVDDGLQISGKANVVGREVFIYNATGDIDLSGSGSFDLTPMKPGPGVMYPGVLIFQPRTNKKELSFSGKSSGMEGTVYLPAARVTISGKASAKLSFIADSMRISGKAASALSVGSTDVPAASVDSRAIVDSGQLRTGLLWVAIRDDGVTATAEQIDGIRAAIQTINHTFGSYGVELIEVEPENLDAADIRIVIDDTSPCGDQSTGILGCATAWGDITLIQGWQWFAGDNTASIGAQQFDYQTIVTHELGHAIGVDHSSDTNSTMYSRLSTGAIRRAFTAHDLAMLATDHTDLDDEHNSLVAALRVEQRSSDGRWRIVDQDEHSVVEEADDVARVGLAFERANDWSHFSRLPSQKAAAKREEKVSLLPFTSSPATPSFELRTKSRAQPSDIGVDYDTLNDDLRLSSSAHDEALLKFLDE